MERGDHLRILVIRRISLNKFSEGGAAMLAAERRSHHRDRLGRKEMRPLVRKTLRVLVTSYVVLARKNRPEEVRPWAIIIEEAPEMPRGELVRVPAMSRPMWPTEE